jgi:hypothetical protein
MLTEHQISLLTLDELRTYESDLTFVAEQERNEQSRLSLENYIRYSFPNYLFAWYNRIIISALNDFVLGKEKRLIIKMRPRGGKTELISLRTPSYLFGVNPDAQIIACSYADSLAATSNRSVQRIIDSPEYQKIFPGTKLFGSHVRTIAESTYLRNSSEFEIVNHKGYYRSAGIGTGITGRGFTHGFIDDYFKDAAEADSPVVRESIWEWFQAVFYTRRQSADAGICICATQWHEEDLIGRLQNNMKGGGEQWKVISFPEILEEKTEGDPRNIGDVLHPERFSKEDVLRTRDMIGTHWFQSLYQQNPTARSGNVFKRSWYLQPNGQAWQIPFLNGEMKSVCAYWDLAYSDNPNADQTSGALMLIDKTNYEWVQEVKAGRWSIAERNRQILSTSLRWNELFPQIKVYLESGMGAGVNDVKELQRLLIANGINAVIDNVRDSKVVRATKETGSFLSASESGMIHFCGGEWNEPALLELSRLIYKETATGMEFTGGHDDILDSLVGCHRKLTMTEMSFGMPL